VTASVEIIAPAAFATLQDLGRTGWRRFGVPRAGVLDPAALRIANALAGNAEGAPAIEFFVAGPTLRAAGGPVRLGLAGDFPVVLTRGGEPATLPSWRSVTLLPGDTLRAGQPGRPATPPQPAGAQRAGAQADSRVGYIAVQGIDVTPVLGSASTDVRAALGGTAGRALAAGDRLPAAAAARGLAERVLRRPPAPEDSAIRVVLGPQDDHFDAAAIAVFLGSDWLVTREADRMGMRLEGPALAHRSDKGAEIVSDATVPGSIQVPGNGLPIVLLADGQTVGGYPKIATVASADLARLATAAVGATLRFRAVAVDEAERLARESEARLRALIGAIAPLAVDGGIDLDAIYGSNLVSGVIDALTP